MPEPLIAVPLAKDWITRLARQGAKIWTARERELDRLFNDFGPYRSLARTYVEPDRLTGNPADYRYDEGEPAPTWTHRVPIGGWLNEFLGGEPRSRSGHNTLFVLSDAGMGTCAPIIPISRTSRPFTSAAARSSTAPPTATCAKRPDG